METPKDIKATALPIQGKTLQRIIVERAGYEDKIVFVVEGGERYVMFHQQDCCEEVEIESIVGDVKDLIGTPLVVAEEASCDGERGYGTWTFYRFRTAKGDVDIRWYGSSNGDYSEGVSFEKVEDNENA
jgi:hypothetical protein